MEVLSFLLLSLTFFLLAIVAFNALTLRLPQRAIGTSTDISVIIPVRNESENARGLVETLRAQTNVDDIQFIFVNDSSTDDTKSLLESAIGGDSRFLIVDAPPLHEGWLGKPWALQQGYLVSTGQSIISLDADVRLAPTAIAQGVQLLQKSELDFISPYPKQLAFTFAERVIQPLLQWSWLSTVPLRLAEKLSAPSMAIANGQFFIARRVALDSVGGFRSIQSQVIDDVELARSLIRSGAHGTVVDGSKIATTRMYSSFEEVRQGYGKSLWVAFGGKVGAAFAIIYIFATGIAPLLLGLVGNPIGWLAFEAVILTRIISAARSRGRITDAFLHPISSALLIYLIIYSWRSRGSVTWKGRTLTWQN